MDHEECPFGHSKNLFALFYPKCLPGHEASKPLSYCLRCKKYIFELQMMKEKMNATAVKKCAIHFV